MASLPPTHFRQDLPSSKQESFQASAARCLGSPAKGCPKGLDLKLMDLMVSYERMHAA